MSTTIVFACKSNSCRSQMAEAWAHEWIKAERAHLERGGDDNEDDRRLGAFLDGLVVASVAIDESSLVNTEKAVRSDDARLGTSPTSALTTDFEARYKASTSEIQCVTCEGEMCPASSRRRKPKEKAIRALSEDGVDISGYYAKSLREILPCVASRRQTSREGARGWNRFLSFAGMYTALEMASRKMGLAHAGVAKGGDGRARVVDSLIVLCSCPDAMKRRLSDVSGETLQWDIEPPTAAARAGEGDEAYIRVSRQIRGKVEDFMDELKRGAMGVEFCR